MRVLSTAVQNKIAEKLGTEPINIVEIQWGGSTGAWTKYADKTIEGNEFEIAGKILSLSRLESVIKLDNQGQSQGLSIILSDSDGSLKTIFDNTDIHGKRCILYQWFEGLPLSERFQIYEGEIVSPIEWSEGDRTLSFEVISKLADVEIGFSPEEGYFPYLPDEIRGEAWPLVFGTCQNVPCTLLSEIPSTQVTGTLGYADPTIDERQQELSANAEWAKGVWFFYTLCAGACANRALQAQWEADHAETEEEENFWLGEVNRWEGYQEQYENASTQAIVQYNRMVAEKLDLQNTQADQESYEQSELTLVDGSAYPQGMVLEFELGDLNIQGFVQGNTLYVTGIENSKYTGYTGEPFGFTFIQSGGLLRLVSVAPVIYIVSIVEADVLSVQAYKTTETKKILTTIPSAYYSVVTETMGPYDVTYIKLDKPLSSYDETYEDDLYATVTTNVGPNTVEILEWLITTYTDHDIDTTSFNNVKSYVENYPSHFALLERKNILTALEEIAFQARCAIWLNNGTFYIKYLPKDYTAVATLDEADVDAGSLTIYTTTTEELVTKLTAKWVDDYSVEKPYSFVLRNNGKQYGIREREIDFYIYTIGSLVAKSATFWLIRLSNIWKHVKFDTYMDRLIIETNDLIALDFSTPYIATESVNCDVLQAAYDLEKQTISIDARVPVRCGEMTEYPFYRPQSISVDLLFPTDEEINSGYDGSGGIGEDVEGGLELESNYGSAGGYSRSSRRASVGRTQAKRDQNEAEERPTDVDDIKPSPQFSTTKIDDSVIPVYDYLYEDYEIDEVEPPEEEQPPLGTNVYPGVVVGKLSDDIYQMTVYKEGLSNPGTTTEVKQLQIETDETIPTGAWTLVEHNRWTETDEEGAVTYHSEWVMQIPVWL